MATTFKTFLNNDVTTTKTLLHEAIPITGTIVSGTYDQGDDHPDANGTPREFNIKNYSHGMFQSVYDYPFLSSSANHIFDISVGYSANSNLSGNISDASAGLNYKQQKKKVAMYNQMAQVLMGHNKNGEIQRFDRDGNLGDNNDDKMDEVIFLNFSRLLVKDEIKKGSFQIKFGTEPVFKSGRGLRGAAGGNTHHILTIADTNAQNDFRINSPAGEYGILSASHTAPAGRQGINHGHSGSLLSDKVGLIFYQAGVCVLTASIFNGAATGSNDNRGLLNQAVSMSIDGGHGVGLIPDHGTVSASIDQMLTGSKIEHVANNIRRRISDISFNNTTELNSTVYFCRANHNEFNYSANPTYLTESKIRVKDVPSDMPISYVTSIGLYSPDNELMATAKLSEPLRKDPTNELTLRVRLDY
jgi:hypothetical protein